MGGRSAAVWASPPAAPAASAHSAIRASRALVNARLARLPRVVHIDRLDLGVELEGGRPLLAGPDAGGLGASEGQLRLAPRRAAVDVDDAGDRKSTRLNSSHQIISYAVFCLKKKKL